MKTQIFVGGLRFEQSFSLILNFGQNEFEVFVEDVRLVFRFLGSQNAPEVQSHLMNPKHLVIELVNWNNQIGTTKTFDNVVVIGNSNINLNMFVQSIGDTLAFARKIDISLFSDTGRQG